MRAKKNLEKLCPYTPGKPIEELKRELGLKKVCKLASNENPRPPLFIRKALLSECGQLNRYPEGDCFYLRALLSKKLRVSPASFVFGNGSDELIVMALRACAPGGNIVVGFPTFLIYEMQAQISGASVRRVPLKKYRYDLDGMARAVDKNTRIIFIANPDNPHGTYVTHKAVERFIRKIPQDVLIFFDEAYFEFASRKEFPRSISLLKERGFIIVTRTFSKAYGLAGLRVGYGITTPDIAALLNKIREPFNVNRVAQVAACAALKNPRFARQAVSAANRQKQFLYKALDETPFSYIKSATNFVLIDTKSNAEPFYNFLLSKGVIVRSMVPWGLQNFIRVTVGRPHENKTFIKYTRQYLRKSAQKRPGLG